MTGGGNSRRGVLETGVALGITALAGCVRDVISGDRGDDEQREVVVSSKTYTEQKNLGYLAYELLENNTSMSVIDSTGLGSNEAHSQAYQAGEIHAYYDYMGSILREHPPVSEDDFADPDELYAHLKDTMEREHPIRILDRADWENTWELFSTSEAADAFGIHSLSDLAEYVNAGNYDITLAFEDDFEGRPDGLEAMLDHYGFEDDHIQAWENEDGFERVVSGPTTGSAVDDGNAEFGIGYGTSAWLVAIDDVTILEDDEDFWPPYHPVGIVHDDVTTEPIIEEMNRMPELIPDAETMRELNSRVDYDDENPQVVIRDYLRQEGAI